MTFKCISTLSKPKEGERSLSIVLAIGFRLSASELYYANPGSEIAPSLVAANQIFAEFTLRRFQLRLVRALLIVRKFLSSATNRL
jgi:hypothetical protein